GGGGGRPGERRGRSEQPDRRRPTNRVRVPAWSPRGPGRPAHAGRTSDSVGPPRRLSRGGGHGTQRTERQSIRQPEEDGDMTQDTKRSRRLGIPAVVVALGLIMGSFIGDSTAQGTKPQWVIAFHEEADTLYPPRNLQVGAEVYLGHVLQSLGSVEGENLPPVRRLACGQ